MVLAAVGKLLRVELAEILFKDRSVACLRKGLNFTRFVAVERDGFNHYRVDRGHAAAATDSEFIGGLVIRLGKYGVHVEDFATGNVEWAVLLRAVDFEPTCAKLSKRNQFCTGNCAG